MEFKAEATDIYFEANYHNVRYVSVIGIEFPLSFFLILNLDFKSLKSLKKPLVH